MIFKNSQPKVAFYDFRTARFFSLRVFFTGGKSADDESNAVQKGIGLMESFFEYLICMIYAKGKSLCSMFCS